jgi:hypothetical protein
VAAFGSILSNRFGRADSKFKHPHEFSQHLIQSNKMIHRVLCAASWIMLTQNFRRTLALPGIEKYLYLAHRNATMFNEMPGDTGIEKRIIADQPILTFMDICNNVSFIECMQFAVRRLRHVFLDRALAGIHCSISNAFAALVFPLRASAARANQPG